MSIVYDRRREQKKNRRGETEIVYGLADPRNGQVRYIGITNDLLARFNEHCKLTGHNDQKQSWLRDLFAVHMLPIMHTLEVVEIGVSAREREALWIRTYQESGAHLLNDEVLIDSNKKKEET